MSNNPNKNNHKKALSSLINHYNDRIFKTLHSPSISQLTNSTLLSPNNTNIENFTRNFQTFHKITEKNARHHHIKSMSPPIFCDKNKVNKAYQQWIYSNQMENSTIIFPQNLETFKTPFHSFNLIQNEEVPFELDESMTNKNFLEKQLNFNGNQVKLLKSTIKLLQTEKYSSLITEIKKRERMNLQLTHQTSKISHSNIIQSSQRRLDTDFVEENLENETSQITPFYKFYKNQLEVINQQPSLREAASFTIVNFKGYLYGGRSNNLLNTLHELNISCLNSCFD